jgi:uncharacterized protein
VKALAIAPLLFAGALLIGAWVPSFAQTQTQSPLQVPAQVPTQTTTTTPTAEVDINTAAVTVIKKSIAQRFAQLKPHLDAGLIGLTHDGLVAVRELGNLVVTERSKLELQVGEENKDRAALYREIARANGRPDWESDLKLTFGARWINRAQRGWYYRDSAGKWQQKG